MRDRLKDPRPAVGDVVNCPESAFHGASIIHVTTRQDIIDDGSIIEAMDGELGDISRGYSPFHTAMTVGVFKALEKAAKASRGGASIVGLWHDLLFVAKTSPIAVHNHQNGAERHVRISVPTGVDTTDSMVFKVHIGPGDDGRPVVTVLKQFED